MDLTNISKLSPKELEAAKFKVLGRPTDTIRVDGKIVRIVETVLLEDGTGWFIIRRPDLTKRIVSAAVIEHQEIPSEPWDFGNCKACIHLKRDKQAQKYIDDVKSQMKLHHSRLKARSKKTPRKPAKKAVKKAVKKSAKKAKR